MASVLKGITVEIGGDTTGLDEALNKVNKRSGDLSRELGEINRLLKMDPGNTDLLAQKQQVLADAVSHTKDKLDMLREAERQVQAQFEKGEVSAEQVRQLQREIIGTEKKLGQYEQAARETADALRGVGKGAEEAEKKSGNLGTTLANAAKVGLQAVGAAAGAAVTGLIAAAESTRDYRTEMGKLDTAFTQNGFSSEAATAAYEDLVGVLGEYDQSVEAANHLAKLTDNEKDLATWTGDILPGVFATFGDSLPIEGLTEAANETAKVGAVTGPLADALNWAGISEDKFNESLAKCTTEQERQALITETLAGLYGEASEAYKEANEEVIRANQANDEWMQSTAAVGGAIEPIITDVKLLGASLLSEAVPGVQGLADAFRRLLSGDSGAASSVGEALSGIITNLLNKVTELAPTIVEVGMALITSLVTTLVSMLPQLVPVGVQLITTVLSGLSSAIPQLVTAVVAVLPLLVSSLMTGLPLILQAGIDLLMTLVQAIPQILPTLAEALPQIITTVVNGLLGSINILLDGALTLFMAIVDAIPLIIQTLVPQIPAIVSAIVQGLIMAIPTLLAGAVQLFMAIIQAIPQILPLLGTAVTDINMGIVQGLKDGVKAVGDAALELGKSILDSITSFFGINSPSTVMKEQGNFLVAGMVEGLEDMPSEMLDTIKGALDNVEKWGADLAKRVKTAANNMLTNVASTLKSMPSRVLDSISGAVQSVATWGTNMVNKAKSGMADVVRAVTSTLKDLPSKVLSIGGDLVTGLWNGINNKLGWLIGKIQSFASSALGAIKKFFGVNSPSKETAWIGEMLDEGLAEGMMDNIDSPVAAMQRVTGGVLDAAQNVNGLTLGRQLQANYQPAAATAGGSSGILDKLDRILTAIEQGQVLTIDGDQLVGATASKIDRRLGQQRALAARGAV